MNRIEVQATLHHSKQYIWKKIKEREALELPRDTQESK